MCFLYIIMYCFVYSIRLVDRVIFCGFFLKQNRKSCENKYFAYNDLKLRLKWSRNSTRVWVSIANFNFIATTTWADEGVVPVSSVCACVWSSFCHATGGGGGVAAQYLRSDEAIKNDVLNVTHQRMLSKHVDHHPCNSLPGNAMR